MSLCELINTLKLVQQSAIDVPLKEKLDKFARTKIPLYSLQDWGWDIYPCSGFVERDKLSDCQPG